MPWNGGKPDRRNEPLISIPDEEGALMALAEEEELVEADDPEIA